MKMKLYKILFIYVLISLVLGRTAAFVGMFNVFIRLFFSFNITRSIRIITRSIKIITRSINNRVEIYLLQEYEEYLVKFHNKFHVSYN